MKIRLWLLVIALIRFARPCADSAYAQSSGEIDSPLAIVLAAKGDPFKVDAPIPGEMVISNTSQAPVSLEVSRSSTFRKLDFFVFTSAAEEY